MALQLYRRLQEDVDREPAVRLPAVVIGGGLTAIDTATELLAYYVVQIEKTQRASPSSPRAHARGGARDVRRRGVGAARGAPRPREGAGGGARPRAEGRASGAHPEAPRLVGGREPRLPQVGERLARVPAQPRGGGEEPGGGGPLHGEPLRRWRRCSTSTRTSAR